jgi:sodium transport system permease protein
MSVAQVLVVFRKEVKDAFRDRRSLYSIVIGSLAGPLITGFMLTSVADRQRQAEEIDVPVVGLEHAPALVAWLRQQSGITVVPLRARGGRRDTATGEGAGTATLTDAEAAVRDRDEDVVVVIMHEYRDKFRVSSPARVKVVSDGSRQASRPKVQRVRTLLQRYSAEIGALRLVGRGVSPAIASPLQIEDVEVSSAQQRAATILSFIPIFVVLAAFTGGMQIATDSTAGERERGSLEPLLVNPAPRHVFAAGKWLAATFAAMLSVIITTSLVLVMLRYIPLQELGIRFRIGPAQIAGLLAALLPLCLLSTSLQAYLATFARSFKEAQSYMGLLIMLPMIPGMVTTVYPITSQPWMYPIPLVGQHVLATDVLGGKPTPVWAFVAAGAAAVVVALGLVRLTTGLLRRERIIFSR